MKTDKGQNMTPERVTIEASSGRLIPVRLEVNPRAKRLIVRIDTKKGEAVAVAPNRHMLSEAANFAAERADWIDGHLSEVPIAIPLNEGAMIPFQGVDHVLTQEGSGRLARIETSGRPPKIIAPGASETFEMRIKRFLKKQAYAAFEEAVERHCEILGVKASRISVKDTRSRWGSCASNGNLSFSWRVICAPPDVLDYLAAHECAHLLEMNHSDRFWHHVERCRPDWRVQRKWLKANGALLHAIGSD